MYPCDSPFLFASFNEAFKDAFFVPSFSAVFFRPDRSPRLLYGHQPPRFLFVLFQADRFLLFYPIMLASSFFFFS